MNNFFIRSEDVCVLSALGTAALVNFSYSGETGSSLEASGIIRNKDQVVPSSLEKPEGEDMPYRHVAEKCSDSDADTGIAEKKESVANSSSPALAHPISICGIFHIPYAQSSMPYKAEINKCGVCK